MPICYVFGVVAQPRGCRHIRASHLSLSGRQDDIGVRGFCWTALPGGAILGS